MSHETNPACGEPAHAQEQQTVAVPRYIRRAVGTSLVVHRLIPNLQVQGRGAEQKIEVAEWVEVTKPRPVFDYAVIVGPAQGFGPAQRVAEGLTEEEGEESPKKAIPQEIEKSHRTIFHAVHQTGSIDELPSSSVERVDESW